MYARNSPSPIRQNKIAILYPCLPIIIIHLTQNPLLMPGYLFALLTICLTLCPIPIKYWKHVHNALILHTFINTSTDSKQL